MMTNTQLYLSVGLPMLCIVIGIALQVYMVLRLNTKLDLLEQRLDSRIDLLDRRVDARFATLDARFATQDGLFNEMRTTFIKDHSERLARLEERLSAR